MGADRLEEIKKSLEIGGFLDCIIESIQLNEDVLWLIAEVERLRTELSGISFIESLNQGITIESLTKERDELKAKEIAWLKADETRTRTAAQILLNRCETISKEAGKPAAEIEEILCKLEGLESENAELKVKVKNLEKPYWEQ